MSKRFEKQYAGQGVLADRTYGIALDWGPTVPADGTAGYAPACLFLDVDATTGSALWVNLGSATSSLFQPYGGGAPVAVTAAALTVTAAAHAGRTVVLNRATGIAVTLPAFAGTGNRYRFVVNTTVSGGTHVLTATGAYLFGNAWVVSDGAAAVLGYAAGGATTITLDGSTKGGIKGDIIEIEDIGTNLGSVRVMTQATGTEATPFA